MNISDCLAVIDTWKSPAPISTRQEVEISDPYSCPCSVVIVFQKRIIFSKMKPFLDILFTDKCRDTGESQYIRPNKPAAGFNNTCMFKKITLFHSYTSISVTSPGSPASWQQLRGCLISREVQTPVLSKHSPMNNIFNEYLNIHMYCGVVGSWPSTLLLTRLLCRGNLMRWVMHQATPIDTPHWGYTWLGIATTCTPH